MSIKTLVNEIAADGVVDSAEVTQLREAIWADGRIDQDEADALFALNDAVSGAANDGAYNGLFVDAITSYLLEDEKSPGEVDSDEAAWLIGKVEGDGTVDGIERDLCANIRSKASSLPSNLEAKFTEWGV